MSDTSSPPCPPSLRAFALATRAMVYALRVTHATRIAFCHANGHLGVGVPRWAQLQPLLCWHHSLSVVAARCDHDRDRKSTRLNSSHVKISYAVIRSKK